MFCVPLALSAVMSCLLCCTSVIPHLILKSDKTPGIGRYKNEDEFVHFQQGNVITGAEENRTKKTGIHF